MLMYEDGVHSMVESYRSMRTSITINKNLKTILITSTDSEEGKTTTAANLAKCFADLNGVKILLIDCDLRKPSIHKHIEVENTKGLTDIITKNELVENCIHIKGNLHTITTGEKIKNPAEMLEREEMKKFIESISKDYDYIFIDSPPVSRVNDACIIAKYIDGILIVSGSNQVKIELAQMTKSRLSKVNPNIIGVILNKFKDAPQSYDSYDDESELDPKVKIIRKIKRTVKSVLRNI